MQMRSEVQIRSVIKALTDVVMPAVDPHNKLAQEQLQLAIGLLSLMGTQLPLQFRFDCDELSRLIDFARKLGESASGGGGTDAARHALSAVAAEAEATLDRARTSPADLIDSIHALRAATGELVTQTYVDGAAESRASVSTLVLSHSKEQLLRDRSWLLMQGWEPDPKAIPPIDSLLGGNAASNQ